MRLALPCLAPAAEVSPSGAPETTFLLARLWVLSSLIDALVSSPYTARSAAATNPVSATSSAQLKSGLLITIPCPISHVIDHLVYPVIKRMPLYSTHLMSLLIYVSTLLYTSYFFQRRAPIFRAAVFSYSVCSRSVSF